MLILKGDFKARSVIANVAALGHFTSSHITREVLINRTALALFN